MRIPYYNPNLSIRDVIKAIFLTNARQNIEQYFADLTGKKYIIVTNSCRSALYLAYKSINRTGAVITTPLTCKVSLDPISESGNSIIFTDIKKDDLNINTEQIEQNISSDTIAVQAIHFGGNSCDIENIISIAKRHKILVIEDCAQSLGAANKGRLTGSFGDIACFSLIKNAYGIGGGILATNSYKFYEFANKLNNQYNKTPIWLILYRIVRNILETKRKFPIGHFAYSILLRSKKGKSSYRSVKEQLFRISLLELKIAGAQIKKLNKLHSSRKEVGMKYYELLVNKGLQINSGFDISSSSFTKYFLYSPLIFSKKLIPILLEQEIEVMHIEQKHGSQCQGKLVENRTLEHYNDVHDHIISLPLPEHISLQQVENIVNKIIDLITSK